MNTIRLGVIGLSDGNGHPYSWSAIFNGYEAAAMSACPFPVIPEYLSRQEFPRDAIPGARVTHIWTQERRLSEHVAAASRIDHVADRLEDMVDQVDAVLLARDDAENHLKLARPFLDAGLPIYIDKPLALSVSEAHAIYSLQRRPGQIFSCTPLAHANELRLSDAERKSLGALTYVEAVTAKGWDRYSVHVIEPLLNLVGAEYGPISEMQVTLNGKARHLDVVWGGGLCGRITALGSAYGPIGISLFGQEGWRELRFADSFAAFRRTLAQFLDIVKGEGPPQNNEGVLSVVRVVEAGRQP